VSPDLIDDVASDFRLGIQTPALEGKNSGEFEVRKAAETMLQIYAHLQTEKKREDEGNTRVRFRVAE